MSPLADTSTPDRIVAAGRELFFSQGFSALTTDGLAKTAGVSKTSIYRHFGNASGVLTAVARAEGDRFHIGEPVTADSFEQFRDELKAFGQHLLELLSQPEIIRFAGLMYAEAHDHPEAMRLFADSAIDRVQGTLQESFALAEASGLVRLPAGPERTAEYFHSLLIGIDHLKTMLGLLDTPFPDTTRRAREATDALFAGLVRPAS